MFEEIMFKQKKGRIYHMKKPNIYGGGAQTNKNGLAFEQTTSLDSALEASGYSVMNNQVYRESQYIGISASKHAFYQKFLSPNGIDYQTINSKKWLPDEAFINEEKKTVYIIEKKFQNVSGSVDEKLPNCHFKRLEYEKLCHPIGYQVEFIYVLSDWFRSPIYRDTLDYIEMMGCTYFYNEIPLQALGLASI